MPVTPGSTRHHRRAWNRILQGHEVNNDMALASGSLNRKASLVRMAALRGVIVAAEGPVFSAGHDFGDMAGRDLEGMRLLLTRCSEVMQSIQRMPQPVCAQVEGLATAAGCQLVASCDLAVAGESARFAVPRVSK